MTGWRVGFIAAAKWIADANDKLQGQVTSGTNSIAQKAAAIAYTDMTAPNQMGQAYRRRRDLVVSLLEAVPHFKVRVPMGAFYAFPDVSYYFGKSDGQTTIQNADDLSMWILEKTFVATVTGNAFGAPKCLRLSTAASDEQLIEAVERIKTALATLK
jgi:aspartate aminotransferase